MFLYPTAFVQSAVQFERFPAEGVPRSGVVNTGEMRFALAESKEASADVSAVTL